MTNEQTMKRVEQFVEKQVNLVHEVISDPLISQDHLSIIPTILTMQGAVMMIISELDKQFFGGGLKDTIFAKLKDSYNNDKVSTVQ